MESRSRHAAPIIVHSDGTQKALQRVFLSQTGDENKRREKFIKDLVYEHPDVIPMNEIEPAFTPLISVCRELPTAAGDLDNLWITPEAGIVLGECKLARNPQSRREVVAQGLDYARTMAEMHYDDLEGAVKKSLKDNTRTLWSFIEKTTELNENQFHDAIERRLRVGRFMILVVGDGIQEGAETLTEYLQLHAGIHAGLALVELSIWKGATDGSWLIVPRIPLRTTLIERGIVSYERLDGVRIDAPKSGPVGKPTSVSRELTSSEAEFYAQLDQKRPGLSSPLREFIASLDEIGVKPEFRRTLILRWIPAPEKKASAGYVESNGKVWLGDGWYFAKQYGQPEIGLRYLEQMANAINGKVQQYDNAAQVLKDGHGPDLVEMLRVSETWRTSIRELTLATKLNDE